MGALQAGTPAGVSDVDEGKAGPGPRGRPMTSSPPRGAPQAPAIAGADTAESRVQSKITVADPQQMVSLLGARDQLLKLIERSLSSDIHVRGNEITITGTQVENALAERVFT